MKNAVPELKDWVELKIILAPEDFKFLKKKSWDEAVAVSDLARQIILRHIGVERGSL